MSLHHFRCSLGSMSVSFFSFFIKFRIKSQSCKQKNSSNLLHFFCTMLFSLKSWHQGTGPETSHTAFKVVACTCIFSENLSANSCTWHVSCVLLRSAMLMVHEKNRCYIFFVINVLVIQQGKSRAWNSTHQDTPGRAIQRTWMNCTLSL